MGTTNTRDLARGLKISFPNISYAFVVGIAGGAPFVHDGKEWKESDIQLGDLIVSTQVIEYDFGREYENGFRRKPGVEEILPRAPAEVANFINRMVGGKRRAFLRILNKTNGDLASFENFDAGNRGDCAHPGPDRDRVYALGYRHKHREAAGCAKCAQCTKWYDEQRRTFNKDPPRWYASGNAVMKSGHRWDLLIKEEKVIGFEMGGAGAWEVFGTIVVKGVVDYADSHEDKQWRGYPAARAVLCAAAMIEEIELPDMPRVG
ncbi:hypothetical protein LTR95_001524 [Oleoguttula sp. CCFEE 5521]